MPQVVHQAVPTIHAALLEQSVVDRCVKSAEHLQKAVAELDRVAVNLLLCYASDTSSGHLFQQ